MQKHRVAALPRRLRSGHDWCVQKTLEASVIGVRVFKTYHDVDTTTSKNFKGKNTVLDRNPTTKELVPKKCVRVSGKLELVRTLKSEGLLPRVRV